MIRPDYNNSSKTKDSDAANQFSIFYFELFHNRLLKDKAGAV
jgi:hypothetical protein